MQLNSIVGSDLGDVIKTDIHLKSFQMVFKVMFCTHWPVAPIARLPFRALAITNLLSLWKVDIYVP